MIPFLVDGKIMVPIFPKNNNPWFANIIREPLSLFHIPSKVRPVSDSHARIYQLSALIAVL
jgi:hypothetical protein